MCTRILWADTGVGPVSTRTFDFLVPTQPTLWWFPAGLEYRGSPGEAAWIARHGSACIREHIAWVDGINDAGLAAHLHIFRKGRYPEPDDRPRLPAQQAVRWMLATCGSVAEVIEALEGVQLRDDGADEVPIPFANASFALEDASGDSAVIEGLDGRLIVHRGARTHVMSNAPGLDEQWLNLERYAPFGGELPVPGNVTTRDRFVRAAYFLHYLPRPSDMREALAEIAQVAHAVALPSGAPYPSGDVFPTRWITAYDLAGHTLYFVPRFQPFLLWLEVDHLRDATTPLMVDLLGPNLQGDLVPHLVEDRRIPQ
ncbi:MAG: linear amide C-N hydrolase [Candidatus Nanopelagicales bacterium]